MENQPIERNTAEERTQDISPRSIHDSLRELPLELIQMILSKLPLPHLFGYRYLGKTWRDLINERCVARMHFLNSCQNPNPSSLLLYSPSVSTSADLYVMHYIENRHPPIKLTNLPFKSPIPKFRIMGSCNGFICVADETCTYQSIFICNPVTGDTYVLPEPNSLDVIKSKLFGFGYDRKTNKHKVIRIRDLGEPKLVIETHILGSESWKSMTFISQSGPVWITGSRGRPYGVFLNGFLHWLCVNIYTKNVALIRAFDTETQETRGYYLPRFIVGESYNRIYFGELGGLLTIAFDDPSRGSLEVWQMEDYEQGTWTLGYKIPRPQCCALCSLISQLEPLGVLMNGNVLVNFQGVHGGFFSYDPRTQVIFEFVYDGLPNRYDAISHAPTFLPLTDVLALQV